MYIFRVGHGKNFWIVALVEVLGTSIEANIPMIKAVMVSNFGKEAILNFDCVEYLGKAYTMNQPPPPATDLSAFPTICDRERKSSLTPPPAE